MSGRRRRLKPVAEPLAVCSMVLLTLAATMSEQAGAAEAAQSFGFGDEKCHYYAGGEVYPGEASRVPVKDHSLHLSKAKSRCTKEKKKAAVPCGREKGTGRGGAARASLCLVFSVLE